MFTAQRLSLMVLVTAFAGISSAQAECFLPRGQAIPMAAHAADRVASVLEMARDQIGSRQGCYNMGIVHEQMETLILAVDCVGSNPEVSAALTAFFNTARSAKMQHWLEHSAIYSQDAGVGPYGALLNGSCDGQDTPMGKADLYASLTTLMESARSLCGALPQPTW